jgi:hypothetical protein
MAKYFRIAEIDATTFERMTGDELDCLQVALLADDGNVYVAVDDCTAKFVARLLGGIRIRPCIAKL